MTDWKRTISLAANRRLTPGRRGSFWRARRCRRQGRLPAGIIVHVGSRAATVASVHGVLGACSRQGHTLRLAELKRAATVRAVFALISRLAVLYPVP
jgi:hypothetical protein